MIFLILETIVVRFLILTYLNVEYFIKKINIIIFLHM